MNCQNCGISIVPSKYTVRKFCSRRCSNNAHKGLPRKKRLPTGNCFDCKTPIRIRKKRCPQCRIKFHLASVSRRKAANSRRVIEWRRRMKVKAVEYKGGACIRCGYNKSFRALQFHHRDPSQKDFIISKPNPRTWEKVKLELDKCDLVCGNCHSEIHDELQAGGDSSN